MSKYHFSNVEKHQKEQPYSQGERETLGKRLQKEDNTLERNKDGKNWERLRRIKIYRILNVEKFTIGEGAVAFKWLVPLSTQVRKWCVTGT